MTFQLQELIFYPNWSSDRLGLKQGQYNIKKHTGKSIFLKRTMDLPALFYS